MRREHDFYPTPSWATKELLKRIPVGGMVLEPCVGEHDIALPLNMDDRVLGVLTNDLDRQRTARFHEDATDPAWWKALGPIDWVITNPPFCVADQIVPLAVKHARRGVAMLLRLTYLEPCEGRGAWLAKYPPNELIVLPRISFTGDGNTDSVTCAWMVWLQLPLRSSIHVVNMVDERQASLLSEATA